MAEPQALGRSGPRLSDLAQAPSLRIAFVGQSVYFRQCALEVEAGGLEPTFFDFRAGSPGPRLLDDLLELDPDVVLVFRPEIIPAGLFAALRAVTIGYLTEPLPRSGADRHADLAQRLWWLQQVDPGNFDRIVSFDPLIADTASEVLPVWRSLPIPVADSLYAAPRPRSEPPSMLFVGRSTEHRERMLAPLKAAHEIVHIGHGMFGAELALFLSRADVQLNLHNNPYPSFENRVCIALACGHLVISEPLSPDHGLRAGVDFLQVEEPAELLGLADELLADSHAYEDVQARGHEQGERFRASRVYPQLVREALEDLAGDGSNRHERLGRDD
jgi:hypothetical protein